MITEKDNKVILDEMFKRVGLEYAQAFTTRPEWYQEASWTPKEQEDFHNWLTKYLMKKSKFNKEYCYKQASWFILHVGWKTED